MVEKLAGQPEASHVEGTQGSGLGEEAESGCDGQQTRSGHGTNPPLLPDAALPT